MPPEDSVAISHSNPYTWDSGMYCRWIAGISLPMSTDGLCGRCQVRVIMSAVYMAPFGAPVLPEV